MAKNKRSFDVSNDIRFENTRVRDIVSSVSEKGYMMIKAKDVHPSPFNEGLDIERVGEYVASMKDTGLLEPIVVYDKGEDGYEILSGHQRFHAWCKELKHSDIRAVILPYEQDVRKRFLAHTQANTLTRNKDLQFWLSRIEHAKKVLRETGFKGSRAEEIAEISSMLNGISKSQLYRYEGFSKLTPELRSLEADGSLSANTLYIAASLDDEQQREVYNEVKRLQEQKMVKNPDNWDDAEISRDEFTKITAFVREKRKSPLEKKKKDTSFADKAGKVYNEFLKTFTKPITTEEKVIAINYLSQLKEQIAILEKTLSD